jgi:hypothetical protein
MVLPWPGSKRVKPSQADGNEGRGEQEPCAQMLGLNQLGKSASRRLLPIGLEMHAGRMRRCSCEDSLRRCAGGVGGLLRRIPAFALA